MTTPMFLAAAALLLLPAFLVASVPRRHVVRVMLGWGILPIPAYVGMIVWEGMTRPGTEHFMSNALLGFSLLSAFLIVPWIIFCAAGFVLGLVLRGFRPRADRPAAARAEDIRPNVQPAVSHRQGVGPPSPHTG